MSQTVLLTGVSGFIAREIAAGLLGAGHTVRGTVRDVAMAGKVRAALDGTVDTARLTFVEADLLADAGWAAAMDGADAVIHAASPFPLTQPKDENELIRPAVEGTLRVLRAATAAGIPRFVQTSSIAAVLYGHRDAGPRCFTAADWTDVTGPGVTAYAKSKTLAERAARDYVAREGAGLHFTSINPGMVWGTMRDGDYGSSALLMRHMLRGKFPAVPRFKLMVADLHDVARAHLAALDLGDPGGRRYIIAGGADWFVDICRRLKARLGADGRRLPTWQLPDVVVRALALVDPTVREAVPLLGRDVSFDTEPARRDLGLAFTPLDDTTEAMARGLISFGAV